MRFRGTFVNCVGKVSGRDLGPGDVWGDVCEVSEAIVGGRFISFVDSLLEETNL